MAEDKRNLPPKVAAMQARKRRKLENGDGNRISSKRLKANTKRATGLRADALRWKDVSLPDHLDDYEGFFGLEEVDDVEVVRNDATGQISFTTSSLADVAENREIGRNEHVENHELDDEWSGFDDDGAAEVVTFPSRGTTAPSAPAGKEKRNKRKTDSTDVPMTEADDGAFGSLMAVNNTEEVEVSAWMPLKLSPDTLASLSRLGFSRPTPIQASAIPEILAGHDVVGKASTGSGKTLAFGIPILETFLERQTVHSPASGGKAPLALILSPTRELAHQLAKHLTALCSLHATFEGPIVATLTGGLSLQKQRRVLDSADIVVGTPGRLWEVISEGQGVKDLLKRIHYLVVDEADRLLSNGHFKEVEEILNALDRVEQDEEVDGEPQAIELRSQSERQTLVFSATFDRGLQRRLATRGHHSHNLMDNKESMEYLLSKLNFREETPKFVDVNPINQLATGLKEGLIECGGTEKDLYLYTLLLLHANERTLIFSNSISAVKRLTPFLQHLNLSALALHSGMPQKARLRSVERFTSRTKTGAPTTSGGTVLVATDVAARGLDIPNVQLVIHYHLPRAADTYVHRSGRTARAGQPGSSILICAPEEVAGVRRLVAKVHAQSALGTDAGEAKMQGYYIRTLDLDRRIVSRLKPRATLAKRLADTIVAKEKGRKEDDFLRTAAEELGVDYDSDEFDAEAGKGRRGRGKGRQQKEKAAKALSKGDVAQMKAELKSLLSQRVNTGVSERYLTAGNVDVNELLRQQQEGGTRSEFLGSVQRLGLENV